MSRKTILGRASLSFLTTDGVLDMDQILQTDPWTQIDNFVQHNFVQNVLNEFNERITLDPKLTPADKSPGKKRATSSGRSPRKSQTDRTDGEKSSEGKETDQPAGDDPEDKKEIAKKSNKRTEGPKGKVAKNGDANKQKEEKAKIPKTGNSGRKKTKDERNKTEESTDTQQLEGTQKTTGKKTPVAKSERKKTVRKRKHEKETEETGETKVVEPTNDKTNTTPEKTITANTSKSKDSKSPIVTSTPKCKSPRLMNSWHDASTSKKDSSVLSNVLSNDVSKHCAGDSYVEYVHCADINNNYFELVAQSNSSKITDTKCKRKTTGKTKEGKSPGNKETSTNEKKDSSAENKETTMDEGEKSKCKKQNEKTATKTDSLASNNTSWKKCAKDISATKDSKDDHDETVAEKTKVKREHKTGEKVERKKKSEDKEASGISTDKKPKSKCKKQDNKKIEGKQIGKFEKRLLKHREKHIRRHERKAERAMEEFSHHVTRIVKKMGHLPECSCSSTGDDDSDTDYSDESSFYDSCCSHSSCSCCDSDTYSEYTLCSSSSE